MEPRIAYVDLLKRSLCDLLAPQTFSAVPRPGGTVVAEVLQEGELERRVTGGDWPMNGTTMVGPRRLDQLQDSVEAIVRDGVDAREPLPRPLPRGFVVIDDYGAIPQCRQAVEDFRAANGVDEEIREIDWTGVYRRRRS